MLSDWDKSVFTTDAVDGKPLAHDVYTKGNGPVVLIIQELPGIGVIGMCLTGNFAISMMADENVLAGVASQPSLPILANSALHMSSQDVSEIRAGLEEKGPMLAFRFQGDKLCTHAKFEALDAAFNSD